MFLVRSVVVLRVALCVYKTRSDTIWLVICGCDRLYISLSAVSMLKPSNYFLYPSPFLFNPATLMSAHICPSTSSYIPARIYSSVYSIYMLSCGYNMHSSILLCLNPTSELVNFPLGFYYILCLPDALRIYFPSP